MLYQTQTIDVTNFFQVIGGIASFVTVIIGAIVWIWYQWRGKSQGQLKESLVILQGLIELLRAKNASLERAGGEQLTEIKELQENQESTRKLNLRLQGTVEKLEEKIRHLGGGA